MKTVSTFFVAAAAMLLCLPVAQANDILLTQGVAKSRSGMERVALDIVSDGNISGFQFSIPVKMSARVTDKSLDLSNCFSELPKTHVGRCAYRAKKGDIVFVAYSLENATLPEGVIGLGSISLPSMGKAAPTISNPVFVDHSGKNIK
ncbi:MAG: hypothetical protein WCY72_03450 [Lysobacteraceae bacterium]